MSDYTPTTVWIEAAWGRIRAADGIPVGESLAEFRRWHAAEEERIRVDERVKAIGDATDRISSACAKARHKAVTTMESGFRRAYTLCDACAFAIAAARGDGEQA